MMSPARGFCQAGTIRSSAAMRECGAAAGALSHRVLLIAEE